MTASSEDDHAPEDEPEPRLFTRRFLVGLAAAALAAGVAGAFAAPLWRNQPPATTTTTTTTASTTTTTPTTTTTVSFDDAVRRVPTSAEAGGFVADLAAPVVEASSTSAAREARLGWAEIDQGIFSIGLVPGTFQNDAELRTINQELLHAVALPAAAVFRARASITQLNVVVLGCDFELSRKTVYIVNRDELGSLSGRTAATAAATVTEAAKVPTGNETWAIAATVLGAGDRFKSQKDCSTLSRLDGRAP